MFEMHKSEVFFWLLAAFIVGVFVDSFGILGSSGILIILAVSIAVFALGYKNKTALLAGFLILAFILGAWRFYSVNAREIKLTEQDVKISGYIDSEPEIEESFQRFVLKSGGERILVTTNKYPEYKYGEVLEAAGKLEPPQNKTSFDYVSYLKKDGIGLTLFFPELRKTDAGLELGLLENIKLSFHKNIFHLKDRFQSAINMSVPEPNAAFINGILLGSRQNIPDDLKDAFNKTGTTHILAISGYNIMIISWAVLGLLIWFFKRRIAFWISVIAIILFVIFTGSSASVVRASIMGLLLSFAQGYGRLHDQRNSIILAGAAMIWINPFVLVFDIGFQLSFAAVLGLIYLYPYIDSKFYKFFSKQGELAVNFKELVFMTLSAQVAVLPLALYHFGSFSFLSILPNVLILSFIPAAMATGFASGLTAMFFPSLGQLVGYSAWAITSYQLWIVRIFSNLV